MKAAAIHITGVVQGVGFRPFVYKLALTHGVRGWVRNTSAGVDIHAAAPPPALDAFIAGLRRDAPPLARIDTLTVHDAQANGPYADFQILHSAPVPGAFQPVSPDMAICADCLRELRDPDDPRYRYPFINCTNCGPRFTIIQDLPYDRPLTTMAPFEMCPRCAAEYADPLDRRFHAQPVACPDCGPQVWLSTAEGQVLAERDDAVREAVRRLRAGQIVALKGLGGFHLACDATKESAVAALRERKQRHHKPFAVMMRDLDQVRAYCRLSETEQRLLESPAAPILLLWQHAAAPGTAPGIAASTAPGQATLGVMLPYTPLHVLLFEPEDDAAPPMPPLVMTSGNFSDDPIVTDNATALVRLAALADVFLLHDRAIHVRSDDSVMRALEIAGQDIELPIRRSRGYAPYPVHLPIEMASVLAVGAEMKNTFCLTRERYAFMSHHIGTMETYETQRAFEDGIAHFERLFRVTPTRIAYDLHPDYLATRYALRRAESEGLPGVGVQHHHAHVAACMAENGHTGAERVIGVAFDGTGYGSDGTIWGGEFLLADYVGFERAAHLKPLPLPGGDAATRKPARIALVHLLNAGLPLDAGLPPLAALSETERQVTQRQAETGLNAPLTSAMGRVFDAVASLLDVCQVATYEGQAAIELEAVADPHEQGRYAFGPGPAIDPAPVIAAVLDDLRRGTSLGVIAMRFHNAVADLILREVLCLRDAHAINTVALTGGVFQNVTLLRVVVPLLRGADVEVLLHHKVPPNDGGLALGQAVIAAAQGLHHNESK